MASVWEHHMLALVLGAHKNSEASWEAHIYLGHHKHLSVLRAHREFQHHKSGELRSSVGKHLPDSSALVVHRMFEVLFWEHCMFA